MKVRSITWATLMLCAALLSSYAGAQANYVTVTGTVKDPDGQPLASAPYVVRLVDVNGNPVNSVKTPNGTYFNAKPQVGNLDPTGSFSLQLVPNNVLVNPNAPSSPMNTRWQIILTSPLPVDQSNILTYQPPWAVSYTANITGAVDLSSQLSTLTANVTYINVRTGQSTFSGWLFGVSDPTLPCAAGVHEGYFYTLALTGSSALWQCLNVQGVYQWLPIGGASSGGINQLTGDVVAGPGNGSQAATLAAVNNNPGTCGDSTHVCQVVTDGKGRTISTATISIAAAGGITQLTGDGAAGPGNGSQAFTLATVNSTPGTCGDSTHVCQHTTDAKGRTTSQTAVAIAQSAINQLTGDIVAGPGTGSQAATLPTVNTVPGTCGDGTHICQVTTNAKGLTTNQSQVAVTFPTVVTSLTATGPCTANSVSGSPQTGAVTLVCPTGASPNGTIQSANYTASTAAQYIRIANGSTPVTITLPGTVSTGYNVVIERDASSTATVTISPNGVTYDGVTTQLIPGESAFIWTDGTGYHSSKPLLVGPELTLTAANTGNTLKLTSGILSCTEAFGGSGTSSALVSGDDAISNNTCLNDSGLTRTITAVKCRSSAASNTTTANPTFGSSGTGTSILSGALTCGSSYAWSSGGTLSNTSWTTGTGIDVGMGGTLTGTSLAVIVEYHY